MEIKNFVKSEFGKLTTITSPATGVTMFVGQEIAELFGHTNLTQGIKAARLSDSEYKVVDLRGFKEFKEQLTNLKLVGQRASYITMLTESGMWKMVLSSKLQKAQAFQDWVASEVLPSIRKTGGYSFSQLEFTQIADQTIREVQIENSKAVNTKKYEDGGVPAIIGHNVDNCKQVSGFTPSEIKRMAGKKNKSAKEILRETNPELAATMSLNDFLVSQRQVKLESLKKLDQAAITVFKEILKLGIDIKH